VFTTAEDSQPGVDVKVLQGERPMANDNMLLGNFRLDGIPPAPRGIPQIEVTFDIDANGILDVTATDRASGKAQSIKITATTNLSEQDVDRMVSEARQHEADDRQRKQLIEARNQADALIYATEKSLEELGDRVPATDRQQIQEQIDRLRQVTSGQDAAQIARATEALEQMSQALGQQLYQTQAGGNGASADTGATSRANDEDVIEGEFETT
jgi:molecular chaperone DnaK